MTMQRFKVFPLEGKTPAIPFSGANYLQILNIDLVDNIGCADFIVGHRRTDFNERTVPAGRSYAIWTHEPFFDLTRSSLVRKFLPDRFGDADLHVFNVHNGQVYLDNFYYGPAFHQLPMLKTTADLNSTVSEETVTLAATNKSHKLPLNGIDISLYKRRAKVASCFRDRGLIKIIGRGWPQNYACEESRYNDRHLTKENFLKQSNINLCYENCFSDYYVTEKIWDAIHAGTLPIYYPNGTIYQNFEQDSFIDGRKLRDFDALTDFILGLGEDEMIRRINRCRDAYNFAAATGLRKASRLRAVQRLAAFLDAF